LYAQRGLRDKILGITRKMVVALAIALLFIFLGLYGGIGYKVNSISESYFHPYDELGYADAVFYCDVVFNPVLYPSYWLTGTGHLAGNFTVRYLPESYYPGEFGGPIWGLSPKTRTEFYVMFVITGATYSDLLIIFLIGLSIEAIGKRELYLVLFSGLLGFAGGAAIGTLIGLGAGAAFALIVMFALPKDNILSRFWRSLWE